MNIIIDIFKVFRKFVNFNIDILHGLITTFLFLVNKVDVDSFKTKGYPVVYVANTGAFKIGHGLRMNNGYKGNPIGCFNRCTFFVGGGATLQIGNNLGISQSAIICYSSVVIGDNVKIGGGVSIFDTDFHSLNPKLRENSLNDNLNKKKAPIVIEDNVFIGAYSIILKGITVGKNSIIGAGSVVTKSVPSNEIWGGNPACFIRKIIE